MILSNLNGRPHTRVATRMPSPIPVAPLFMPQSALTKCPGSSKLLFKNQDSKLIVLQRKCLPKLSFSDVKSSKIYINLIQFYSKYRGGLGKEMRNYFILAFDTGY